MLTRGQLSADGKTRYAHEYTPGPHPAGYVNISVDMPPEYMAAMRAIKAETRLAVNEQIRRAVRAQLCGGFIGLVYTSLPIK